MQPIDVIIFSDYLCPFCFIAKELVKRIRANYDLNVIWRPYDLHPTRSMIPPLNSPYIKMAWQNVQRIATENQITIKLPKFLSLTRWALEMAEFARDYGKFKEVHERIFNAYFLEGQNIEAKSTLLNLINDLGLDIEKLKQSWQDERYYQRIQQSIKELHSVGITGVPTFFIGNKTQRILVGVHSQERLEQIIQKAQNDLSP
ncbi:MAG: DsbA family oxidoreductase [Candidatus Helarchaeota archaeon]